MGRFVHIIYLVVLLFGLLFYFICTQVTSFKTIDLHSATYVS